VPDKAPPADQKLPEAPKAAKAEDKDKPRFDFYRILPGKEEPVTERQMREAAKQAGKPGAPRTAISFRPAHSRTRPMRTISKQGWR